MIFEDLCTSDLYIADMVFVLEVAPMAPSFFKDS